MERLKLRARIVEKYGTIGAFCDKLGIAKSTATRVLSGKTAPTSKGITKWCAALEISTEESGKFFYPETLEIQS